MELPLSGFDNRDLQNLGTRQLLQLVWSKEYESSGFNHSFNCARCLPITDFTKSFYNPSIGGEFSHFSSDYLYLVDMYSTNAGLIDKRVKAEHLNDDVLAIIGCKHSGMCPSQGIGGQDSSRYISEDLFYSEWSPDVYDERAAFNLSQDGDQKTGFSRLVPSGLLGVQCAYVLLTDDYFGSILHCNFRYIRPFTGDNFIYITKDTARMQLQQDELYPDTSDSHVFPVDNDRQPLYLSAKKGDVLNQMKNYYDNAVAFASANCDKMVLIKEQVFRGRRLGLFAINVSGTDIEPNTLIIPGSKLETSVYDTPGSQVRGTYKTHHSKENGTEIVDTGSVQSRTHLYRSEQKAVNDRYVKFMKVRNLFKKWSSNEMIPMMGYNIGGYMYDGIPTMQDLNKKMAKDESLYNAFVDGSPVRKVEMMFGLDATFALYKEHSTTFVNTALWRTFSYKKTSNSCSLGSLRVFLSDGNEVSIYNPYNLVDCFFRGNDFTSNYLVRENEYHDFYKFSDRGCAVANQQHANWGSGFFVTVSFTSKGITRSYSVGQIDTYQNDRTKLCLVSNKTHMCFICFTRADIESNDIIFNFAIEFPIYDSWVKDHLITKVKFLHNLIGNTNGDELILPIASKQQYALKPIEEFNTMLGKIKSKIEIEKSNFYEASKNLTKDNGKVVQGLSGFNKEAQKEIEYAIIADSKLPNKEFTEHASVGAVPLTKEELEDVQKHGLLFVDNDPSNKVVVDDEPSSYSSGDSNSPSDNHDGNNNGSNSGTSDTNNTKGSKKSSGLIFIITLILITIFIYNYAED